MAKYLSKTAAGQVPCMSLMSALVAGLLFEFSTPAAALATGDIIVMGPVEPGAQPVDVTLITDDLDTGGTLTLAVGILNAAQTDIDAAATATWIAANAVGQTGGTARATTANCYLSGRASVTRQLGVKVVAGAAGSTGAGKKVAVLLHAAG
jgi:hypothetical protein